MGNIIGFSALQSVIVSGNRLLCMGLSTAGTVGSRTLCLGSRNISLANYNGYALLCIFNDTSAVASSKNANITGIRYSLATSGQSYCLVINEPADLTPTNSIVVGDVPLAVNAEGQLIVQDCTTSIGTPDQEDVIFIADEPLRVVRKGSNWYLAVTTN